PPFLLSSPSSRVRTPLPPPILPLQSRTTRLDQTKPRIKASNMSKVGKRDKFAKLRALKQSGKKAFDEYEVEEPDSLYEEVDEDQYKKIVRDRLNQDDFVVDDNGEGYADDGREEWDRIPAYEYESDEELPVRGKDKK